MTLGGSVCIRNGFDLDFCFVECIKSLLPVCDVVSVCDGESTDGTQEFIRAWMKDEPKLSLCVYPWPEPKGDPDFWVTWLNYAREHLKADWHLQLDADEVLHERCREEVIKFINRDQKRTARVTRFNFWKDHRSLIPDGECLGKSVIRIAPQSMWMASDGCHSKGDECTNMSIPTGIEIFHYGFIRKPEAFFKKERLLQGYFFDRYDSRLEKAQEHQGNWMEMEGVTGWENKLDTFSGDHPAIMNKWLEERGYVD